MNNHLRSFNQTWTCRAELFRRYAAPPPWSPGVVITPEMHRQYELYLPISEFLHDLRRLARACLPTPAWLPRILLPADACGGYCPVSAVSRPASLAGLWAMLPEHLAGKVTFAAAEVFPLLCALASPPRFGTDFGRYPAQLERVSHFLASRAASHPLRILDLACGTGQGTLELAQTTPAAQRARLVCVGVTREPLEVWMAVNRRLPHAPEQEAAYQQDNSDFSPHFVAGDLRALPLRGRFDLVVANGIVGGSSLSGEADMICFAGAVKGLLAEDGRALLANRFHAGTGAALQQFMTIAAAQGFDVQGDPQQMELSW